MIKKSRTKKERLQSLAYNEVFLVIASVLVITIIIGAIAYYQTTSSRIYVDNADIEAPIISLSTTTPGILNHVFVKEGQSILPNTILAEVGGKNIESKTRGVVIYVQNTPGQFVTSRDAIVKMIDPQELRIVGHLDEDKGLRYVKVGQQVIFTVDAFGSKEYKGFVDEVSPSSHASDIVFSISDKREEKEFDIKVKFNPVEYPELKNGMSARMWIYK